MNENSTSKNSPLSSHEVHSIIEDQWEPYKEYGDTFEEIKSRNQDKSIKRFGSNSNGKHWIIFYPKEVESEITQAHKSIEEFAEKLGQLRAMQIKLHSQFPGDKEKYLHKEVYEKRKIEVQDLYDDAFKVVEESLIPKESKKAVDVFPESESLQTNQPQVLQEIFIDHKFYLVAIEALQKVHAIDSKNENLLGSKLKGVIQVWIDILRKQQGQLKFISDSALTILLNKEFKGLNLSSKTDGKHFRNPINKNADSKYRSKLIELIR